MFTTIVTPSVDTCAAEPPIRNAGFNSCSRSLPERNMESMHAATVAALRSGFGSVGWDVAANAPAPGTAPPAAAAILELLAGTFAKLRPTLEAPTAGGGTVGIDQGYAKSWQPLPKRFDPVCPQVPTHNRRRAPGG